MESLMPYLVAILVPLFVYLFSLTWRKGSGRLPPGSVGWPILGENVEFRLLGSQRLMKERMQKYSLEVFKTCLFGEKLAVLCGAGGNKFIFTNEKKLFTPWFPVSLSKVIFPDFDHVKHQEPEATFYNFKHEVLKPEALRQYIPVMDKLAREHLRHGWMPNSVVKVGPATKKYTLELACKLFMDVVDPERLDKLLGPFSLMTAGMVSLPINFHGTDFNRALRGGRVVRAEVLRIVEERRKELEVITHQGRGGDLMSKMLLARSEPDGKPMSDTKVANMVVGLLVAGLYEISAAITIVTQYLAQLPHIYDLVFKGALH